MSFSNTAGSMKSRYRCTSRAISRNATCQASACLLYTSAGTARIVEHGDRITGYATDIGFFSHAVGQTNDALKALIGAAPAFAGPGFLLPTRNAELLRWCLTHGLRVVQPMTLMSRGLYQKPAGAFLPSVLY